MRSCSFRCWVTFKERICFLGRPSPPMADFMEFLDGVRVLCISREREREIRGEGKISEESGGEG